jgi:cytochrome c553
MNLITPMFRNDATIKNVAAHIEGLEPGGPPMTIGPPGNQRIEPRERPFDWQSEYAFLDVELSSGDPDNGESSYQQYCVACHGAAAEGNQALGSPPLINLADWYIARQMQYFRDGVRGADSRDIYGLQMVPFGKVLTDEQQIADVAAYIKTLAP